MKNTLLLRGDNVAAGNDQFDWKATSADPQFTICDAEQWAGKRVVVRLAVHAEQAIGSPANLYFDDGEGLSETRKIEFGYDEAGVAQTVMHLPLHLRALRLDPIAQAGYFSIQHFSIKPANGFGFIASAALQQLSKDPGEFVAKLPLAWRAWRASGFSGLESGAHANVLELAAESVRQANGQTYAHWIERYEPSPDTYDGYRQRSTAWSHRPLISVLMPMYNTPDKWLRSALDSVVNQVYENWELCVADDASTQSHVLRTLSEYASRDMRIKVIRRPSNGHISAASNSALEIARGDFCSLLDHDDELHPLALYCVAQTIGASPTVHLIYSDEDKITERGERRDPYFKCDFNYDLFLGQNMISHLGTYRTTTLRKVGGFRLDFVGSQDYDLALRVLDECGPSGIAHIPRVLYHWRTHAESTAQTHEAKPYALEAAQKAIKEHLVRNKVAGTVEISQEAVGFCRVRYAIPSSPPSVEIIIPTRDGEALVRQCVESILGKSTYTHYSITIIDNGSTAPGALALFDELKRDRGVRIVRDDSPFNYAAINNRVAMRSTADFVLLLNNDIEVISPDWLGEMVSVAIQPGVGSVGARLWYPDNTLQHGGVILGVGGVAGHSNKYIQRGPGYFSWAQLRGSKGAVTGACLLTPSQIYRDLGGLEERLTVAFNDIDYCLKVSKAGYRNVWTPHAELYHHESASRGQEDAPEKVERFNSEIRFMQEKWSDALVEDSCYSLSLTLEHENLSLAWPSRAPALQ